MKAAGTDTKAMDRGAAGPRRGRAVVAALLVLAVIISICSAVLSMPQRAEADNTDSSSVVPVYRLCNATTGTYGTSTIGMNVHRFVTSYDEVEELVDSGDWEYEALIGYAPSYSDCPVYELYKTSTYNGYTAIQYRYELETYAESLVENAGWTITGIAFYNADGDSASRTMYTSLYKTQTGGTSYIYVAKGSTEYESLLNNNWAVTDSSGNNFCLLAGAFINVDSSGGGSVSSSYSYYTYTSSRTLSITADDGYYITSVSVDGTTVYSDTLGAGLTSYTLELVGYRGTAEGDSDGTVTGLTADVTVSATFSPIEYTIAYDANGGTGSMSSQSATYDEALTVRSSSFYRHGYAFSGWNTEADGSGTSYEEGEEVENLASTYGATVTLYAQWTEVETTVSGDGFVIELNAGEAASIALPAGTSYLVYELTPSGWTLVSSSGTSGDIEAATASLAAFENTYTGEDSVSVVLAALKTLDGSAPEAGAFSFALAEGGTGDVIETVESGTGGGVVFSALTFTEAGTWTYTITEVEGSDSTIVYDASVYTATVTVTEDGDGALTAEVAYASEDGAATSCPVFQNESAPGTLRVVKELSGAALSDQTFTVLLTYVEDGATVTESLVLDASNGWTAEVALPAGTAFSLEETDLPDGCTLVSISNRTGTVEAGQTVTATVENAYAASGSFTVSTTKTLVGRALEEGEFTFALTDADGEVVRTAVNDADGTVSFAAITLYEAGTYTYTITEVEGSEEGVTYSDEAIGVTVVATDEGDGTLSFDVSYSGADGFTNYAPNGSLSISKTVTGGTSATEEQVFSFTVVLADATDTALEGSYPYTVYDEEGDEVGTGTVSSGGTIELEAGQTALITGLPAATLYEVSEGELPQGYSLSSSTGAEGVIGSDATATAAFVNAYATAGSYVLSVSKELVGRTLEEGAFTFLLLEEEDGEAVDEAANATDGTVSFSAIEASSEGTWTHYIVELVPGEDEEGYADDIEYATATIVAVTTAIDNGDGTLSFSTAYTDLETGEEADALVNSVRTGSLQVTKAVLGATDAVLAADPAFAFTLTISDGEDTALSSGGYAYSIVDEDGGEVSSGTIFPGTALSFQLRDGEALTVEGLPDGTLYEVAEEGADGYTAASGDAEGEIVGGETAYAWFVNTYDCEGSFTATATKALEGDALEEGMFSFVLADEDGEVVATGTNAADGTVTFTAVALDAYDLGTTTYTMYEVDGTDEYGDLYVFDDAVFTVELTCTDNGDGTMEVSAAYFDEDGAELAGAPAFTNVLNTTDVSFTKVDMSDTSVTLEGAVFVLYRYIGESSSGSILDVDDVDEDTWEYVGTATSDEDGAVAFEDVVYGETYRLVETVAPAGYVCPSGQWNMVVTRTADEDGGYADVCTFTAVYDLLTAQPPAFATVDGEYLLPNSDSTELPTTGGTTTALMVATGATLIAGAALLLARRRDTMRREGSGGGRVLSKAAPRTGHRSPRQGRRDDLRARR